MRKKTEIELPILSTYKWFMAHLCFWQKWPITYTCLQTKNYHYVTLFSDQRLLMVFNWSSSNNKSLQVSRTLLSILADLNKAVVSMVSTRPLISKSSTPFTHPLVSVPSVTITIGITVPFIFHSFFKVLRQGLGTFFHLPSISL